MAQTEQQTVSVCRKQLLNTCQEDFGEGMAGGQELEQAEQGKTKEQQEQDLAEVGMLCPSL